MQEGISTSLLNVTKALADTDNPGILFSDAGFYFGIAGTVAVLFGILAIYYHFRELKKK